MRAIWSFWSLPYARHYHHAWAEERYHLLSWVLSVHSVGRFFDSRALHTDSAGARLLVDTLGLPFDEVHTDLDLLDAADSEWWALGKLHTYRKQQSAFLHFDSDVYLWQALKPELLEADLLTQNPDPPLGSSSFYHPHAIETLLAGAPDTWLPEAWRWFRQQPQQHGECCGVFGGQQLAFIHAYADDAIKLVEHPGNQQAWPQLPQRRVHNVLIEQFLLAAHIARRQAGVNQAPLNVAHIFPDQTAAFAPDAGQKSGYTHLIAEAKHDPAMLRRLAARVERDYPAHYARALSAAKHHPAHRLTELVA